MELRLRGGATCGKRKGATPEGGATCGKRVSLVTDQESRGQ